MGVYNGLFTTKDISGFSGPGGKVMHPFQNQTVDECGVVRSTANSSFALYGEYSCSVPPELYALSSTKSNAEQPCIVEIGGESVSVSPWFLWNHAAWLMYHLVFNSSNGPPSRLASNLPADAVTEWMNSGMTGFTGTTVTQTRGNAWKAEARGTRPGGVEINNIGLFTVSFGALQGKCSDVIGGFIQLSISQSIVYCSPETKFKPVSKSVGTVSSKFALSDECESSGHLLSIIDGKLSRYCSGAYYDVSGGNGILSNYPAWTVPYTMTP